MKNILVTGGTGTLGRLVTPQLRDAGCDVRVLSRTSKQPQDGVEYVSADLIQGDGLDAALEGIEVVLHLAGGPKGDDVAARNLVAAAQRAGVKHLVYIGVIAADKMPFGYFKAKLDAEQTIANSGIPYTTVRVAQFHDFVLNVARMMTKLPVVPLPGGLRFQPVDARDVADRMVELTLGAPAGRVPDLTGPQVYGIAELTRDYLKANGKRRLSLPLRMPGKAGRLYRAGENLTLEGATVGTRTWEDFLATR